jgi:hypothetical protein
MVVDAFFQVVQDGEPMGGRQVSIFACVTGSTAWEIETA